MPRRRGLFITLEGVEGAGKSTAIDVMERRLQHAGVRVERTREPGGTPLSEAIRGVMLADWEEGMPGLTELLLVFAARAAHLEHRIRPALARGVWVLSDRFTDATYAYQGAGRKIGVETIAQLEKLVQGDLRPDRVVVLDLPVEQGFERARKRGWENRFDRAQADFMESVRQAYLARARTCPGRYHVVDASVSVETVTDALEAIVDRIVAEPRVRK